MRLISRLERREDRFGTRRCPKCGGHGSLVVIHVLEDEPAPTVQGCPICGEACHIVVRFRSRPLPDARVIQSALTGGQLGELVT